jgi:dTMP kinase
MPPARRPSGALIVLDGPDGCGKSTQATRLVSSLRRSGRRVLHLREPGGTRLGESLRAILLDPSGAARSARSEALLYVAARAQVAAERIRPALLRGVTVVCERFSSSTIVYQGLAAGLDPLDIEAIDRFARDGVEPLITLVLDVPPETGLRRVSATRAMDRIERRPLAYHRRVRRGFLEWAKSRRGRAVVIDAARDAGAVAKDVREEVTRALR